MKLYATSRVSRRLGEKLFLKAERDATQKSAMVRRPYPPGMHGKRRRRGLSEFGIEIQEKQKVRYLYGISDAVLKKHVRSASRARGKTKTQALLELLECRLDNAVYRLGLAPSRRIARQAVSHGHVQLNGKLVHTASILVKPGDRISTRESSRGAPPFADAPIRLKKYQPPAWLALKPEELAGSVVRLPSEEDNLISQNLSKVIEFYSR